MRVSFSSTSTRHAPLTTHTLSLSLNHTATLTHAPMCPEHPLRSISYSNLLFTMQDDAENKAWQHSQDKQVEVTNSSLGNHWFGQAGCWLYACMLISLVMETHYLWCCAGQHPAVSECLPGTGNEGLSAL